MLGLGAAMGWSASEVKAASLWEIFAAWNGYVDANTPKQPGKLSESEADRIWARMQEMDLSTGQELSTQTYTLDGARLVPGGIVSFRVE